MALRRNVILRRPRQRPSRRTRDARSRAWWRISSLRSAGLLLLLMLGVASAAKLLVAGMQAPSNWGEDYKKTFDALYPELARAHGVALYPFFLDGVAMEPALNQPDGLHPNARGVAALVDRIAPHVAKL